MIDLLLALGEFVLATVDFALLYKLLDHVLDRDDDEKRRRR